MFSNSQLPGIISGERPIFTRTGKLVNFIYRKHPWIFHLVFWAAYFLLSSVILSELLDFPKALLRSVVIIFLQASLVYINFYLLNRFLFRNNVPVYFLLLLIAWFGVGVLRAWIEATLLLKPLIGLEPLSAQHLSVIFLTSFLVLVVSSLARFIDEWYQKRMQAQELESAKLEADLRFLQSQVNPHFLFNVLNMIYTQAYTGSPETAPTVMKLSNMMRYMLEATRKSRVNLQEELDYLRDFIAMQDLKKGRKQNVELKVNGQVEGIFIEPMLFIPFLENAFKHGNVSHEADGWVKGELKIEPGQLEFSMGNSLGKTNPMKDKTSGVGLENIKKRLELLYPGRHQLKLMKGETQFEAILKLNLSPVEES
ncbi:MAG: histidine kinase [Bacteroidia bacterium]|nr:histidine kinase [Bacteroidia bacterium]